jgi:predicted ester cyclase
MNDHDVRAALRRTIDPTLYDEIRALWKRHSIAEDGRDLEGLVSRLTPGCIYDLPQHRRVWTGHDGARAFYTEFLTAFPDVHFDLQNIVIGPQGVYEEAVAVGTHEGEWLGEEPSGKRLEWRVIIYFPWDSDARLFAGERVWIDDPAFFRGSVSR